MMQATMPARQNWIALTMEMGTRYHLHILFLSKLLEMISELQHFIASW